MTDQLHLFPTGLTRQQLQPLTIYTQQAHCVGADDLVRGHEAIFLTQLDTIEPVDPRHTRLVDDSSSGYRLSKLFLEAQLRQMPATGVEPDLTGMGAFKPMPFQVQTVARALQQLRPRLLLADAVGLGKTIQVGMILSELMRRGRANCLLVLAKKSMLAQFQSELWNRFGIPLVRLDSDGIARLLARRTDSMLLTTATPHNGKPETFARLISLLDPSAIPDPDLRAYDADDIRGFFLMRFKEDVRQDQNPDYLDIEMAGDLMLLTAPADLRRRLGAVTNEL